MTASSFTLEPLTCKCSRPDRLKEIADRFNLDHSAMLDNVLYARAYTSEYTIHEYIWYTIKLLTMCAVLLIDVAFRSSFVAGNLWYWLQ